MRIEILISSEEKLSELNRKVQEFSYANTYGPLSVSTIRYQYQTMVTIKCLYIFSGIVEEVLAFGERITIFTESGDKDSKPLKQASTTSKGRPPTTGRFDTRKELVEFIFDNYQHSPRNMTLIARAAKVSLTTVSKILDGGNPYANEN